MYKKWSTQRSHLILFGVIERSVQIQRFKKKKILKEFLNDVSDWTHKPDILGWVL